jgi:hypothetical protein
VFRRISLFSALGGVAAFALVVPSGAFGATTLGETFVPAGCSEETYIQTATPPGAPSYTTPFSGVITRWSYQSDSTPPPTVKLKLARDFGGGTLQIVAESAAEPIVPSSLNTYQSQIPVPAGVDLGEFIGADCSREDSTYTDYYADGDLSVGTTSSAFTSEDFQQDISAVLEHDCDNDGLGDETQDTNLSSCPHPTTVTGQRAAALKKCKKKAQKKHWSNKKLKKCKKKAKLLPV